MKISIITVAYNNSQTIKNAIDSVLSQAYQNIEYIVIDGASTDGTVDVVRSYGIKLPNLYSSLNSCFANYFPTLTLPRPESGCRGAKMA